MSPNRSLICLTAGERESASSTSLPLPPSDCACSFSASSRFVKRTRESSRISKATPRSSSSSSSSPSAASSASSYTWIRLVKRIFGFAGSTDLVIGLIEVLITSEREQRLLLLRVFRLLHLSSLLRMGSDVILNSLLG